MEKIAAGVVAGGIAVPAGGGVAIVAGGWHEILPVALAGVSRGPAALRSIRPGWRPASGS